jgi:hypothetical protein
MNLPQSNRSLGHTNGGLDAVFLCSVAFAGKQICFQLFQCRSSIRIKKELWKNADSRQGTHAVGKHASGAGNACR